MKALKYIGIFLFLMMILHHNDSMAQNQWAFLRGNLDEQHPWDGNYQVGVGISSSLNKPAPREHCGSGVYKDKFWIFGGDGFGTGSDIWCYDTKTDNWTFVGDKGNTPSYTDLMTESLTAHPGKRSRMASAVDKNGNLWVFGGDTYDLGFHTGRNDLWKFNTITNLWTWMGGSSTHSSAGSYQNPSQPNWPRARYRTRGWFDEDGNYWIFGGFFYDGVNDPYPLNDMWKYNLADKVWTCETGNCNGLNPSNAASGNYPATVGLSSTTYSPRARGDFAFWSDYDGNFWLFGGTDGDQHATHGSSALSDTWKYNPITKEWTLITPLWTNASNTNPGGQIESLCWLGNDGLPWMRLINRSVWKLKNNVWENQKIFTDADNFTPPIYNNKPLLFNATNQPGSQFTTFDHIKTDKAVYLYNGYGMTSSNTISYMGALWKYSLEIMPQPEIKLNILTDNFNPFGESPYTVSTREIIAKNIGTDSAKNIVVNIGYGPINNHSAININEIEVRDSLSNTLIASTLISGKPFLIEGLENELACGYDTNYFKTSVDIKIPFITAGQSIKIIVHVKHCMSNFYNPTNYLYSWNYWGVSAKYISRYKKKFEIEPIIGEPSKTLLSNERHEYQTLLSNLNTVGESQHFTLEIGSGTKNSPTNNQDLGNNMTNAQARLDLILPPNYSIENGSLLDIEGEYAIEDITGIHLFKVNPVSIEYKMSESNGNQPYMIKFPKSRYLPIRRIYVKLRSTNGSSGNSNVKGRILTTFNTNYATDNYGWKAASN